MLRWRIFAVCSIMYKVTKKGGFTVFKIVEKEVLNPVVERVTIEAPLVAAKCEPGQFVILRVEEDGERIPLTVSD